MLEGLLSDVQEPNRIQTPLYTKKKERHYLPFIPKMYWFFYHKPIYFLVVIPSFLTGFFSMLQSLMIANVIDSLMAENAMIKIRKIVIFGFFLSICFSICTFINYTGWTILGASISHKVRRILFRSLMEKDIQFFDSHSIGDLLSMLTTDAHSIERAFVTMKSHTLRAAGQLVSAFCVSFAIDYRLAFLPILVGIFIFFFQRVCRQMARIDTKIQGKAEGESLTIIEECFANFHIISSFSNSFLSEKMRYKKQLDIDMTRETHSKFVYSLCWTVTDLLNTATSCFLLNIGSYFILKKSLTVGQLFTLTKTTIIIGTEIAHLLATGHMNQKGMDALDKILDVVENDVPTIDNFEGKNSEFDFKGKIEFKNVYFRYPTLAHAPANEYKSDNKSDKDGGNAFDVKKNKKNKKKEKKKDKNKIKYAENKNMRPKKLKKELFYGGKNSSSEFFGSDINLNNNNNNENNNDDGYVLKNVSFVVNVGDIVAFVGHSGCGKSTIVQLLLRFYDVDEGQILFDDVDIKEISPSFIHKVLGVVQQETLLFDTTIKENIKYGNNIASDKEVQNCCEVANISEFIESLPMKYDTIIGERGSLLSGGQRQRMSIARAVLMNPIVLITDEATSALDAESENDVQKSLDVVMQGRTSIMIAHRLGTIRAAKKIFVMENGEIVEIGSHDELMMMKGIYYRLVLRQTDKHYIE